MGKKFITVFLMLCFFTSPSLYSKDYSFFKVGNSYEYFENGYKSIFYEIRAGGQELKGTPIFGEFVYGANSVIGLESNLKLLYQKFSYSIQIMFGDELLQGSQGVLNVFGFFPNSLFGVGAGMLWGEKDWDPATDGSLIYFDKGYTRQAFIQTYLEYYTTFWHYGLFSYRMVLNYYFSSNDTNNLGVGEGYSFGINLGLGFKTY